MSNCSELIILIFSLLSSIGYGDTGAIYKYDTKAVLKYDGYTEWFAPTEIHSICKIEIDYFPFDEQSCPLRFGSWTYTGTNVMCSDGRCFPTIQHNNFKALGFTSSSTTPSQMLRFTV